MIFIRHYSQKNTTQIKEKKEEGTDRKIYTVVAHINVSHEQMG